MAPVSLSPLTQTYTLVPLVGFTWAHARQTARAGEPHGGACATERWRGGSAFQSSCTVSHMPSLPQS